MSRLHLPPSGTLVPGAALGWEWQPQTPAVPLSKSANGYGVSTQLELWWHNWPVPRTHSKSRQRGLRCGLWSVGAGLAGAGQVLTLLLSSELVSSSETADPELWNLSSLCLPLSPWPVPLPSCLLQSLWDPWGRESPAGRAEGRWLPGALARKQEGVRRLDEEGSEVTCSLTAQEKQEAVAAPSPDWLFFLGASSAPQGLPPLLSILFFYFFFNMVVCFWGSGFLQLVSVRPVCKTSTLEKNTRGQEENKTVALTEECLCVCVYITRILAATQGSGPRIPGTSRERCGAGVALVV